MMAWLEVLFTGVSCVLAAISPTTCASAPANEPVAIAGPIKTGEAVDVVLSAQAALVWDVESGTVLYERAATERRPVASLSKLLSVLVVTETLAPGTVVEIPAAVRVPQRQGAHIRLPVGEHATVQELVAASLVASANDAVVALAYAHSGSEESFVTAANARTHALGLTDTKIANSTGLSGGEQYSTARDVRTLFTQVYEDQNLRPWLAASVGTLTTQEGTVRRYDSTNALLDTYVPILAAKTGYTVEAGQNLAIITQDEEGHTIGAVVLGSEDRFQDMKVLVEWIWRNYTWQE